VKRLDFLRKTNGALTVSPFVPITERLGDWRENTVEEPEWIEKSPPVSKMARASYSRLLQPSLASVFGGVFGAYPTTYPGQVINYPFPAAPNIKQFK